MKDQRKFVKTAANEGYYFAILLFISLLGGLAAYFALAMKWPSLAFFAFLYFISIIILIYVVGKRQRTENCLFSFSRSWRVILADIMIKTLEISVFSLVLDVMGTGKRFEDIISNTKYILFACVCVIVYLIATLLLYSPEAYKERTLLCPSDDASREMPH